MIETWDDLCKKAIKLQDVYPTFGEDNETDLKICNLYFNCHGAIRAKYYSRGSTVEIFIASGVSYDKMYKIMQILNKKEEKK